MDCYKELVRLKKQHTGSAAKRILAQCEYALKLCGADPSVPQKPVEDALEHLMKAEANGVLANGAASEAEALLMPLAQRAKCDKVICVPHAHIDMNWISNTISWFSKKALMPVFLTR